MSHLPGRCPKNQLSHYRPDGRHTHPHNERPIHIGSLPGTFTMALRLPGDIVIVVLCNQSVPVSGAPMDRLAGVMERAAAKVKSWPTKERDLR
jgi:hypothetical protein